jgi:hypothetical protein
LDYPKCYQQNSVVQPPAAWQLDCSCVRSPICTILGYTHWWRMHLWDACNLLIPAVICTWTEQVNVNKIPRTSAVTTRTWTSIS